MLIACWAVFAGESESVTFTVNEAVVGEAGVPLMVDPTRLKGAIVPAVTLYVYGCTPPVV